MTNHSQSDLEADAQTFVNAFNPDAYKLEQNFGWLTESQRQELGERTQAAIKATFVEFMNDIYDGEV